MILIYIKSCNGNPEVSLHPSITGVTARVFARLRAQWELYGVMNYNRLCRRSICAGPLMFQSVEKAPGIQGGAGKDTLNYRETFHLVRGGHSRQIYVDGSLSLSLQQANALLQKRSLCPEAFRNTVQGHHKLGLGCNEGSRGKLQDSIQSVEQSLAPRSPPLSLCQISTYRDEEAEGNSYAGN